MNSLFLFLLCLPALFAAVWAHYRLSAHSPSTRWITSGVLVVVGLAFGWVMASVYTENQGLEKVLIFTISFGMAHVPAAFILQLKHWRGSESDQD